MLGGQWYGQWLPNDVRRYWGSDKRLGTQVGERRGRDIVTTGKSGYLLFGPYLNLAVGDYKITVYGRADINRLAGASIDIVTHGSSRVIKETTLCEPFINEELADIIITLDEPCTDLEIRILVNFDTSLVVSSLNIHPL